MESFNADLQEVLPQPPRHSEPQSPSSSNSSAASDQHDICVAVMGVTGSGICTFIPHCTELPVEIGHTMESCMSSSEGCRKHKLNDLSIGTQQVIEYPFIWKTGVTVHMVDTPGFDDTNRTDTEVLREIAAWLTETYANNIKLSGIIYLHRITDRRLQGSAKRNLFMFKKLCGDDALKNIVLATTMWEHVSEKVGHAREAELVAKEDFWGWMVQRGSQTYRHSNTKESALSVLKRFAINDGANAAMALDIQTQMVEDGKTLDQTSAGMQLEDGMMHDRSKLFNEVETFRRDLKEASEQRDLESTALLREQQAIVDAQVQLLDEERERLKIDIEQLHQEREAKIEGTAH